MTAIPVKRYRCVKCRGEKTGDTAEIVAIFERKMPIKPFRMGEDKREHEEEAPLRMTEAVNLLDYIAPTVKTLDWLFDEPRDRVSRRFIRQHENSGLERAYVDGKVRMDNEAVHKYLDAFDTTVLEPRDNITFVRFSERGRKIYREVAVREFRDRV